MKKERKDVAITLLKTPEHNSRIHPAKQIKEIRRCLRKWGQYKNVVIDENYVVLAGNGLVEAMRAEGIDTVNAVMMYGLSEKEKDKLMLADNKTEGLGVDNLANIERIIRNLEGDFDIPGFDDDILKSIDAASEEISQALDGYGIASPKNLADIDAKSGVNLPSETLGTAGPETLESTEISLSGKRSIVCPKCGEVLWL